jgi:hypothetical protein
MDVSSFENITFLARRIVLATLSNELVTVSVG